MITCYHGIGAYLGQKNPMALSRQLSTVMSGVEVCGSDKAIGAFGCVISGSCRVVFERDVWSYVNDQNERDTHEHAGFIYPVNQAHFDAYAQCSNSANAYTETWICAHTLRAIWVKEWADDATKKAAAIIARNRKVPLLVVSGKDRIFDADFSVYAKLSFGA